MFEGYTSTSFMEALKAWDNLGKKVICYHRQNKYVYASDICWKSDFMVDASMILEGKWYVED